MSLLDIHGQYEEPQTIQIDFDGTLAHRTPGSTIIGAPIPMGIELVRTLHNLGYRIIILTANKMPDVVGGWLVKHGVPFAAVTSQKGPAIAYIDDRAIPFTRDASVSSIVDRIKELSSE